MGLIAMSNSYHFGASQGAKAMIQSHDKGFAIAGWASEGRSAPRKGLLIGVHARGDLKSTRQYGGDFDNQLLGLAQLPDSTYVAVGYQMYSNMADDMAIWVAHADEQGKLLDEIIGKELRSGRATGVVPDADGKFVVACSGIQRDTGVSVVSKYDTALKVEWSRVVEDATALGITGTSDDGYAVCGRREAGRTDEAFVVKLDSDGEVVWEKAFSEQSADPFLRAGIAQAGNGDLVIAGRFFVMRVSEAGDFLETTEFPSRIFTSIVANPDGTFTVGGSLVDVLDMDHAYAMLLEEDAKTVRWDNSALPPLSVYSGVAKPEGPVVAACGSTPAASDNDSDALISVFWESAAALMG